MILQVPKFCRLVCNVFVPHTELVYRSEFDPMMGNILWVVKCSASFAPRIPWCWYSITYTESSRLTEWPRSSTDSGSFRVRERWLRTADVSWKYRTTVRYFHGFLVVTWTVKPHDQFFESSATVNYKTALLDKASVCHSFLSSPGRMHPNVHSCRLRSAQ